MTTELLLDSRGNCFLCLKQILDADKKEGDAASGVPPLYSLQDVTQYLGMELGKVLNEKEPIPEDMMAKLENSRLKVPLCGECIVLNDQFSEVFQQLEKINLKAVFCIKRMHDQLVGAVETGQYNRFREIFASVAESGDEVMIGKLKIVNLLRIEAMRKSARCLYKAKRSGKLQMLNEKVSSGSVSVVASQPASNPKPNQACCDEANSENIRDFEMEVIDDDNCNMGNEKSYDFDATKTPVVPSPPVVEPPASDGHRHRFKTLKEKEAPGDSYCTPSPEQVLAASPLKVELKNKFGNIQIPSPTPEKQPSEILDPRPGPSRKIIYKRRDSNVKVLAVVEKFKLDNPPESSVALHSKNSENSTSSKNAVIIIHEETKKQAKPMQIEIDQSDSHQVTFESLGIPTIVKVESVNSMETEVTLPPLNLGVGDPTKTFQDLTVPHSPSNPGNGKYRCDICSMRFVSRSGLQSHSKSVHLNVRFKCEKCDKEFVGSGSYRRHYKTVHMGVRHACGVCGKTYSQICHLKYHKRTSCLVENRNPGFQCRTCGKVLAAANVLQRHIKTVHLKLKEHACSACGRTFHLNCQLQQHLQKAHGVVEVVQA